MTVVPLVAVLLAAVIVGVILRGGTDVGTDGGRAATGEIVITDARMPLPFTPTQASVYLTVTNRGDTDDALVGARAAGSASVTLHRTDIEGSGQATMSSTGLLTVPPGSQIVLQPGGDHLMLDVPAGLAVGDTYPITVLMERGGEIDVDVEVMTPADAAAVGAPR